jgi:hypothetical protein
VGRLDRFQRQLPPSERELAERRRPPLWGHATTVRPCARQLRFRSRGAPVPPFGRRRHAEAASERGGSTASARFRMRRGPRFGSAEFIGSEDARSATSRRGMLRSEASRVNSKTGVHRGRASLGKLQAVARDILFSADAIASSPVARVPLESGTIRPSMVASTARPRHPIAPRSSRCNQTGRTEYAINVRKTIQTKSRRSGTRRHSYESPQHESSTAQHAQQP